MRTAIPQRSSREFEELAPYLKAVRDFPPLTREDEHGLALRARKGDNSAKQKLVRHNLAFVVAIARKQRRGTVRLDDLIQEGNVGLMRAVEKFDPHAGTRFSTYAVWWIRAYIGKYLKEARSTVRPQSGTVAQPDLSLDSAIDEEGDATHLERIEDEGPGPEDLYLSGEGDREVRDALILELDVEAASLTRLSILARFVVPLGVTVLLGLDNRVEASRELGLRLAVSRLCLADFSGFRCLGGGVVTSV